MTRLGPDRRLVLYDREGAPYRPVRDGGTGRSIFKIKPQGASNRADGAIHTEHWLEVARAILIDGLAARCQAFSGGPVNYLKFGAQKLVRYELDPEIAQELGIPEQGGTDEPSAVFSRAAVEAALDAFDAYQDHRAHAEIFSAFGSPRDYWVRSSRLRPIRVYPTKPVVGYLLNSIDIHGGWNQPSGPVSQLHNSGFIIVDADDRPSELPDKDYVLRGADRIRLCALNYFIEPAREQGASEVSIRAGDLAAAMGLQDAFPNICQALGGEKFQQLAQVPPPTHTEPNPSSSTIFTYKLASQAEAATVTEETKAPTRSATNLILYGPPGTGKTYRTAWEAVRLCLGEQAAAALQGDNKRDALMVEYRRLVSEGRIEFVTFHQSMSYEDFVEGRQPMTGPNGDGEMESVGFRLEAIQGIFRRIAKRAETSRGRSTGDDMITLEGRQVFKMSIGEAYNPDDAHLFKEAIDGGYTLLGFDDIDLSDEKYASREAVFEACMGADG